MGFDTQDLLRQGRFTEGDYVPLVSAGSSASNTTSTSGSSFTNLAGVFQLPIRWDRVFSDDVETAVTGEVTVLPGSGETASVRFQNTNDNETALEQTNITSGTAVSFPVTKFRPTTQSSRIFIRLQGKTDPGSDSTSFNNPLFTAGVVL